MRQPAGLVVTGALSCLLLLATVAAAEGLWVLWVETPMASDQWTIAHVSEARFPAKADCQRRAEELNSLEVVIAKTLGASSETRDQFSCLPDAVDPRP